MKLIYGVGVNDADYVVQPKINGKQVACQFYERWKKVLERCYSEKCLEKHPSYIGCTVVDDWKYFMNFKSWMEKQDWQGNTLDKDILFKGNRVYGPETCVFITNETNVFLTERGILRGEYPIGVTKYRDRYVAQVNQVRDGSKHVGVYDTPDEAHQAWLKKKLELAKVLALKQTDNRVAEALVSRYNVEVYECLKN